MSHGWKNADTWTVALYIGQTELTHRAARALILRAYSAAYQDAIAEPTFPERGAASIVEDARATARVVAGDTLDEWTRKLLDRYAPLAIVNCADRLAAAYAETFSNIARAGIERLLDDCDFLEIARHYIDEDTRACEYAARQVAECANVPYAITWTRHAEHMTLNAVWLGYPRDILRASAEKIARERGHTDITGSHVMDAAKRIRNRVAYRSLPAYYGATCHIDADGYYLPTLRELTDAERAEYMSGARSLDSFKRHVAIDGNPIDGVTVQVSQ